jgi:hypothetical protein
MITCKFVDFMNSYKWLLLYFKTYALTFVGFCVKKWKVVK